MPTDHPKPKTQLRPYQLKAVMEVIRRLVFAPIHLLITSPVGSGKTTIASAIITHAAHKGQRVLFIAHRRELIDQAYRRLQDFGIPEDSIGVIMADDPRVRPNAPVQVASIDTLRRRAKPAADLVFVDECLPAGTLVDGCKIENLRVGEKVKSFNFSTRQIEERSVAHVFRSPVKELVTVHFGRGRKLTCTPGHPLYLSSGECIQAGHLEPYVPVITRAENNWLEVSILESVEFHEPTSDGTFGGLCPDGHVYNIEVEGNHNYFANGILTHNCHRAAAKSYRDITEHYHSASHIGLTATPYRMGSQNHLSEVYDEMLIVASPQELIQQGFLVEPRVFSIPESELPDFSQVRTRAGDYSEDVLSQMVNKSQLVGNIVDHWFRHARGIRTVVFATSIAHSKHITQRFRAAGVAAEHLDAKTPLAIRRAILRRLASGRTRVAVNVGILGEGFDMPSIKCAVLARPTRSTGLFIQQAGRILRPYKNRPAIILDHAGCVHLHGLPHDPRELSLDSFERIYDGQGTAPTRRCQYCGAVTSLATRICPNCNSVLAIWDELPIEKSGQLVEITANSSLWAGIGTRSFEVKRPVGDSLVVTINRNSSDISNPSKQHNIKREKTPSHLATANY